MKKKALLLRVAWVGAAAQEFGGIELLTVDSKLLRHIFSQVAH